jgi:hypothetical protein
MTPKASERKTLALQSLDGLKAKGNSAAVFSATSELYLLHRIILIGAWVCFFFVAFATLVPLHLRPQVSHVETWSSVLVERVGAYAILGVLFSISYPRRYRFICAVIFGSAVVLEALQVFVPDRDARVMDAVEKLMGGGLGIAIASWLLSAMPRSLKKLLLPVD